MKYIIMSINGLLRHSTNYLICKCFLFLFSFPGISRATKKAFAVETLAVQKKIAGFAFLKKNVSIFALQNSWWM